LLLRNCFSIPWACFSLFSSALAFESKASSVKCSSRSANLSDIMKLAVGSQSSKSGRKLIRSLVNILFSLPVSQDFRPPPPGGRKS
jgi:hypothetical protein